MNIPALLGFGLVLGLPTLVTAQTPMAPPTLVQLATGNTLEVVYPDDGPRLTFMFKSEGTFTAVFPDGVAGNGDYVADDRYVCWIVKVPMDTEPGRNVRCEANSTEGHGMGESWTVTDSYGDKPTLTIRPGQH
ncbi:hypothetical protein [Brevundimonas sp.]|uniref:hypothetical protein n=1 Tax=Brevundimonas sp. TaxID=1871086 RepID=UPI003D14BF46